MDFSKRLKILLCFLLSGIALAEPTTSKIIAFSGGPAWYHAGHTQTLLLQPNYANTYAATTPTQTLASGELFLGVQHPFATLGFWQLGLAIAASSEARLQGTIWETADPSFDNFTYQYKTTHAHVAAKTKWLIRCGSPSLLPYVSASLGIATNQSYDFSMSSILGVEQITNTTGTCNATSTANSCLLYLVFHGDQTTVINDGPIISTGSSRTRPSVNQTLHLTTAAPTDQVDNNWIRVLIEQDVAPTASASPPNDLATYILKIKKLAPALQQFHLRVDPHPFTSGDPIYAQYASTITAIRAAYPSTQLIVGFHPDNNSSEASCLGWGCDSVSCAVAPADWDATQLTCMLNASIQTMNAITALLPAGQGFDTYSIEQGYVEPMETCPLAPPPAPQPPACLQQIKACFCPQGTQTANGTACPSVNSESCLVGITLASPSVTYGNVLGSYGGSEIYGLTGLDFGYPQYYNLGKQIAVEYDALISGGYFPSASTACHSAPYPSHLYVVDVDTPGAYTSEIPCPIAGQPDAANIYTNPSPAAPDVTLASNYLAFVMTQYPPILGAVNTNGAQVFITLSGEPNFLGAAGWSLANIYQLNYNLSINFIYLQKLYPDLFPSGIPSMQWAIWNFGKMLDQITV